MGEITEKNTKAEILEAYLAEKATNQALSENLLKYQEELNQADDNSVTVAPASDKVTIVIPYVAELAQGNELSLALRGWYENFDGKFNVVIIGSGVSGLSDLVHVIECDRVSDNPPLDIAHKMLKAIESDMVSEKFIWANDDQYLISPCMLADFEILKCAGQLGETKFGSSSYQQNKKRTFDLLRKAGKGTWDFSTHIPVVFEKQKLQELISEFNLEKEAHLIATLYFNWYFEGFVPLNVDNQTALDHDNIKIGVYRQAADFERLKKLMPGKKIISNSESGWSPKLAEILNNIFPEKCPFEA